jgi:hypothetical protein
VSTVRGLRTALAVAAATTAFIVVPAAANAASGASIYHPDLNARSFVTGDGGWEPANGNTGLCLPPLTCPSVTNGFAASGGTFGAADGYLRTSILGLTGVASESRGTLRSPVWTYTGVNGEKPTDVVAGLSHLADVGALLSVAGNSVQYSFELVDQTAGKSLRLVDEQSLRPDSGWTDAPLVTLKPGQLTIGHQYRLRIITRFIYGAEVIPGGSVGYDDVALLAIRDESTLPGGGGGGGGGNNGGGGGHNGGGGGGGANNGSAVFDGRNLFIKLSCQGVSKNGKCWDRATALKSKKGTRYTFPIQRVVNAKKGKVIRARVRFQFRSELERQRSITLRSVLGTSRDDKSKVTKYKKLTLIKRG